MTHVFSPYQINPFNLNPLKSVLSEVVDFDRLAKCKMAPRLFLSATNVRTGKAKVFENDAMSIDVVLALRPSSIEIGTSCVACVTAVAQRRPSGWTPISTRSGNRPRSISPRFF
jgi:hypothetical protein